MPDALPGKMVFVVGAGASYEVGLPLGTELKKTISQNLDIRFENFSRMVSGDSTIYEAFRLEMNDLVEKSIRNRMIVEGWNEAINPR